MLYNKSELPKVAYTAGRITIMTAVAGVVVFVMAFVFDFSAQELSKVSAQTASTTLTVLNTPPVFTVGAHETVESSQTTPTNSGDNVTWAATATDSNGAPYFLLVCSTDTTPIAAASAGTLGTAPPSCADGTQWGVSAATPSGTESTVATTTTEVAPFAESNDWYAWVCDDDPVNPRCSTAYSTGLNATNSSPFVVNKRPVLTAFGNDGPIDPGAQLGFLSTSTDPDTVGGEDAIYLVVCQTNTDYNSTTNTCDANFLASTTVTMLSDASATYTLASIVRDDTYPAYAYIVDEHGHEAVANGMNANFVVNNVAPTVLSGDIDLNDGADITLTEAGSSTPGFTLDFTISDANSCVNAASTAEITDYTVALYRSSIGTTTCDGTLGSSNPNNCYPSGDTNWTLSCTASSTSCGGPTDDTQIYNCTFPLWFVADPTDNGANTPAAFEADTWIAAVSGTDDDAATGPLVATANPVDLVSLTALDLLTAAIPYGSLEPGEDTGTLNATTTINNIGNTGLDQEVEGESMCGTFAVGNECPNDPTSTIAESQQQFSSTSLAYNSPLAVTLSSTTPAEVELDVLKTTSTSSPEAGVTYWGIGVPISVTLAGSYQGLNTFTAVTAEPEDWQ